METLDEAKIKFVKEVENDTTCPCCNRHEKVNRVSITSAMVASLQGIADHSDNLIDDGRVRVQENGPDWLKRSNSHSKLQFWGLLERKKNDDKKKKSFGISRPT